MKKLCTIYTNCQGNVIEKFLQHHPKFQEEYDSLFFQIDAFSSSVPMSEDLKSRLRQTSLFIYMIIAPDSPMLKKQVEQNILTEEQAIEYQTDSIKRMLPDGAISISIPNVHFEGYHVEYCREPRHDLTRSARFPNGLFGYGNRTLIKLIKQNQPLTRDGITKIIKQLNNKMLYSSEEIYSFFRRSLYLLREKEKVCDVKVSDFILNNFTSKRLFHAANHPSSHIFNYLIEEIFKKLGYEMYPFFNLDWFSNHQVPISPCIINHYNLGFMGENPTYLIEDLSKDQRFTHDEYWTMYITTLYQDMLRL